jgi:hypothetical protein
MKSTTIPRKKIKPKNYEKGFRALKDSYLSQSKIYVHECEKGSSIGRTLSILIRKILELQRENPSIRAYFVQGAQLCTLSGKKQLYYQKYRTLFEAGSKTKGPFLKRDPSMFCKFLLRHMLQYKSKHRKVYKKICFIPAQSTLLAKHIETVNRLVFKVRDSTYTPRTTVKEILNKIHKEGY